MVKFQNAGGRGVGSDGFRKRNSQESMGASKSDASRSSPGVEKVDGESAKCCRHRRTLRTCQELP